MGVADDEAGFAAPEDSDRVGLAGKLRDAREYVGLSQDEVAKAVGIARSAISLIENGQRRVDALELKRLAQLYGRTVSYFTGDVKSAPTFPAEVEHLARTASTLSRRDQEELARFAEFLRVRAEARKK